MSGGARRGTSTPSPADRAGDLIAFLTDWLDPTDPVHVIVWDAVRYEFALASLGPWFRADEWAHERSPSGGLTVCGHVILHEFQSDPPAVVDALKCRELDVGSIELAPRSACIWRSVEGQIALVWLDALSMQVLSLIAEGRPLQELIDVFGTSRAATMIEDAARRFMDAGIVAIRDLASGAPRCV
jgi:hypothetical protein